MAYEFGVGEYETRDGSLVTINEVFAGQLYGRFQRKAEIKWHAAEWNLDGSTDCNRQLQLRQPKQTRTFALNFYAGERPVLHESFESARLHKGSDCIATKEFTIEFTPGEGLD